MGEQIPHKGKPEEGASTVSAPPLLPERSHGGLLALPGQQPDAQEVRRGVDQTDMDVVEHRAGHGVSAPLEVAEDRQAGDSGAQRVHDVRVRAEEHV